MIKYIEIILFITHFQLMCFMVFGKDQLNDKFDNQNTKVYESDLKLHKCVDLGEAYSAAYLTTREHLLLTNIARNLSRVSCEMASTVMLSTAKRSKKLQLKKFLNNPKVSGLAIQSIDVLDYSVVHLSAYERSLRKFSKRLGIDFNDPNIEPIVQMGEMLKKRALRGRSSPSIILKNDIPEVYETIVLMPFLGTSMGAGHSNLNNRYQYLKVCFWSLYAIFPYISAGVISEEDKKWALEESGLPWYDVILVKGPKNAALPLATLMEAKKKLRDKAPRTITTTKSSNSNDIKYKSNVITSSKSSIRRLKGNQNKKGMQYYNGDIKEENGIRDIDQNNKKLQDETLLELKISQQLRASTKLYGNANIIENFVKNDKVLYKSLDEQKGSSKSINDDKEINRDNVVPIKWDFKYVFWTESDQVLMVRILHHLYSHLQRYPRRMLLPHRLMPYPDNVLKHMHKRQLNHDGNQLHGDDWRDSSCCLPRQNCIERKTWKHISNSSAVPVVNVYGIQVPLGNTHFRIESYRGCNFNTNKEETCP